MGRSYRRGHIHGRKTVRDPPSCKAQKLTSELPRVRKGEEKMCTESNMLRHTWLHIFFTACKHVTFYTFTTRKFNTLYSAIQGARGYFCGT